MKQIIKFFKTNLEDLFIEYGLKRAPSKRADFIFIIHPRHRKDIEKHFPMLKTFPDFLLHFLARLMWPIRVHRIKAYYNDTIYTGWTVGIMLLPEQILKNRRLATRKIHRALRLGSKMEARIAGLGALTPSVTKGGSALKKKSPVSLTNGYPATVKAVAETTLSLIQRGELKKEKLNVAVVGAAGSVGNNVSRFLANYKFNRLMLFDVKRKEKTVKALRDSLKKQNPGTKISTHFDINKIKEAHIIITATNAEKFVLHKENLSSGTIVVDDAQPSDVDPDVINQRKDIVVTEAGIIYSPNTTVKPNIELAGEHDLFSCLAEVVLLTINQKTDKHFSLGRLDFSKIEELDKLFKNSDFQIGEYQNYTGVIKNKTLENVFRLIQHRYEFD